MLWPLITYSIASTVTPGPNNVMLFASGANFGLRRTVPHILGVSFGHAVMILGLGAGLMQVFAIMPAAHLVLKSGATAYLLWLAYRVATAAPPSTAQTRGQPFSFVQAATFQWVNPKAWAMHLNALALFAPPETAWGGVVLVAVVLPLINTPCVTLWALLGATLKTWLRTPRLLQLFNVAMAALLVASLIPIWRTAL
ncbi:LysE family translocator [Nereida sp. MMG025]|uniref:LysE family translocator n=1 Tax=Nereida sp. MMG025 TaxID=2909981 RepID=UPI001F403DA7|nr:LysE family translocator [Nereida sp. MMG025]MCF6445216.1 LysE family translocator [Nereida sp. MMG025]